MKSPPDITTAQHFPSNGTLQQKLRTTVTKIDRWWILNVEVPTNSDFDGQEIDETGVTSGNMIFLQLMMQIAAGDESADEVYTSFMKTVAEWNH